MLDDAAEMRRVMTLFDQVWGTTPVVGVELLRAIGHGGGYVAATYVDGQVVGGSLGFLARHAARCAAQPHHRHPARRPPHRARPGDEAAPAGVGGRARAGLGDVDVRPAGAAQRLVQPPRARRRGPRVPDRLLRTDRRRHQRQGRERPPARGLVDARRGAGGRRRAGTAAGGTACRRPRTSSCSAAPIRPPPRRWRRRVRDELGGPLAAGGRVVDVHPRRRVPRGGVGRDGAVDPSCARSTCLWSRRSRPASGSRPAAASCSSGPRSTVDGVDAAEGWGECVARDEPATRPSTSTAPRSSCATCCPRWPASRLDAADVGAVLAGAGHPMAKAALEMAVLDAELRATGRRSPARLGVTRDRIPSGVSVGIHATDRRPARPPSPATSRTATSASS